MSPALAGGPSFHLLALTHSISLSDASLPLISLSLSVFNFLRIRTWLKLENTPETQKVVRDSMDLAQLEGVSVLFSTYVSVL